MQLFLTIWFKWITPLLIHAKYSLIDANHALFNDYTSVTEHTYREKRGKKHKLSRSQNNSSDCHWICVNSSSFFLSVKKQSVVFVYLTKSLLNSPQEVFNRCALIIVSTPKWHLYFHAITNSRLNIIIPDLISSSSPGLFLPFASKLNWLASKPSRLSTIQISSWNFFIKLYGLLWNLWVA